MTLRAPGTEPGRGGRAGAGQSIQYEYRSALRREQRPWTVGGLAAEVALSRSAFAARFRELVGEPPMRYLVRARLAHAAGLLHTTDLGLGEIARRTATRASPRSAGRSSASSV